MKPAFRYHSGLTLALVLPFGATYAASTWTPNVLDQGVPVTITGAAGGWTTNVPVSEGDVLRITGTFGGTNMGSANTHYYVVGVGASGTNPRFSQVPGATTFTPSAAANNPLTPVRLPSWSNAGNWIGGVPNGVGAAASIATNASTWAVVLDRNVTLGSLNVDTSIGSSVTTPATTFNQSGLSLMATSRNAGPVSTLRFASPTGTPTVTLTGGSSLSFSEDVLTGATPGNSSAKLSILGNQGLVIDNRNPMLAPMVITTGTTYAPGAVRFGFGLDWSGFTGDLTLAQGVFQTLAGGSLNNNLSALPLNSKVILGSGTNAARLEIVNSAARPVMRGLESSSPFASVVNTTGTNSEAIEIGSYGKATDVFNFAGNIGATGTTASNAVRVSKIGAGTQILSGQNQMNAFMPNTVLVGVNGGTLSLGTTGAMGTIVNGQGTTNANATVAMKNGEFALSGAGVNVPRSQTFEGALMFGVIAPNTTAVDANQTARSSGLSTLTVEADPSQPATLSFGSVRNRNFLAASGTTPNLNGSTMLYRGTNLGAGVNTPGVASIVFSGSAPVVSKNGYLQTVSGTGAIRTTAAPVLKGALADTSATGNGQGFATYESGKGVRLLDQASEQVTVSSGFFYNVASSNSNIRLNLLVNDSITGKLSNTLQIENNIGSARTLTNSGNALNAANGFLFSGANPVTLTGGEIVGTAGIDGEDVVIHSINTGGVTIQTPVTNVGSNTPSRPGWITYNGPGNFRIEGTQTLGQTAVSGTFFGGIAFNGTGTTTLAAPIVSGSHMYVNKGTVKLEPGASWSNTPRLAVASGATFDLNGVSADSTTNRFSDIAPDWQTSGAAGGYMSAGGTVTNTSATTVDLVLAGPGGAASQPFYGTIEGNLNLVVDKGATNTQSLGNANTYTGDTLIRSGVLNLARGGNLPPTTVVRMGSLTSGTTATLTMGDGNGSTNGPARLEIAGLYAVGSGTASVQNQGANMSQLTLNIPAGVDNVFAGNLGAPVVATGSTQNLFAIRKTGAGTFEPSGSITNYSGGLTIEDGVYRVSSEAKLGQLASVTGTAGSSASPLAPLSAMTNRVVLNGGTLQATTTPDFVIDPRRGIGLGPTEGSTGGTGTLAVDAGVKVTYGGVIASAGNTGDQVLIKTGDGTLVLNGANTFTGTTRVADGLLAGNGTLASSLVVEPGAVFDPGITAVGNFTLNGGVQLAGTLGIDITGSNAADIDLLTIAGLLDLSSGTATLELDATVPLTDPAYVFATYGTLSGVFASVTNLPTGYAVDYAYQGNSIAIVPVPEPTTFALLGAPFAVLLLRRRRA